MGKLATKIPNLCLIMIRPQARVSPPSTQERNANEAKQRRGKDDTGGGDKSGPSISGRKIMIVVDSTVEFKNAVQWALTHTVQNQDRLIFLHVAKPSKQGGEVPQFLTCMKNYWQIKKPEVRIEVMAVEGKEKGPAVVAAAKKEGAALLVVGQKKRWVTWRLMLTWAGNRAVDGMAEYCVQNASCMAIAVRRKSNKLGGYVITTKRQKEFWLLA